MSNEGEFYDHLFQNFNSLRNEPIKLELWKSHQITELMYKINDKDNKLFVQNALIVIMALFDEYLKDSYHHKSKNINELNDGKKEVAISILREEIFS
ncbi:MAG: hypothetical protein ACFFDK_02950 [Promethearchaeota archaeon]